MCPQSRGSVIAVGCVVQFDVFLHQQQWKILHSMEWARSQAHSQAYSQALSGAVAVMVDSVTTVS